MEIPEALTFDDVLLVPAESSVLPSQTDLRTKLTRSLELGIPLVSAAMGAFSFFYFCLISLIAGGDGRMFIGMLFGCV